MKFTAFFLMILAALAMLISSTEANPKVKAGSVAVSTFYKFSFFFLSFLVIPKK